MNKNTYSKVMIIDDSDLDRLIAQKVILKNGFGQQVINMPTATEALRYLEEAQSNPADFPDLIFLDISMPVMNGFQFLDEYDRKINKTQKDSCTIIMLTSSLNQQDYTDADNNPNVTKLIIKPLDEQKLNSLSELTIAKKA